jgi:hypothetical protein
MIIHYKYAIVLLTINKQGAWYKQKYGQKT